MVKRSIRAQFLQNVCSGWLAQFSAAIVGVLMLPYNLHYLGKDVYGISVLAVSMVAMLEFLSLGMRPALLRFFSQSLAENDQEEFRAISSVSQLLLGGAGLLGVAITLAAIPWFLRFYEIPEEHAHSTAILLACLAGMFFVQISSITFNSVLLANCRHDISNVNMIAVSWLRFLLLIFFYHLAGPSLAMLGLSMLIASLLGLLSSATFAFRQVGNRMLFSVRSLSLAVLPPLFSVSFLAILDSVCFSISMQVPLLIIGKNLGVDSAALFAPVMVIALFLSAFLCHASAPLAPLAALDRINNEGRNISDWAMLSGELLSNIGYACVAACALFMPDILRIWLGKDFVAVSPVVVVFVIGIVYTHSQAANFNLALGAGTIAYAAYSMAALAGFVSLGTLVGTLYFHWGLLEIALWISALRVSRSPVFLAWIYSKSFHYSFRRYFFRVYLKPAFATGLFLVLFHVFKGFFQTDECGLPFLLVEMSAVGILYAPFVWFLGLSGETRDYLLKKRLPGKNCQEKVQI